MIVLHERLWQCTSLLVGMQSIAQGRPIPHFAPSCMIPLLVVNIVIKNAFVSTSLSQRFRNPRVICFPGSFLCPRVSGFAPPWDLCLLPLHLLCLGSRSVLRKLVLHLHCASCPAPLSCRLSVFDPNLFSHP